MIVYDDQMIIATNSGMEFYIMREISVGRNFVIFYARFGPSELDNYTRELVKLQQIGTVLE